MTTPKPVVLCILDGWGLRPEREANAVALADTPNFDRVMAECPHSTLTTFGPAVGLPEGQMGNSEVGHMNIGAGRVVWMDLPKINKAIEEGSFAKNAALKKFIKSIQNSGGVAHVAGLASPGGVHAHQDHIVAVAEALCAADVPVAIHAYLDGRDVAPKSAKDQIAKLEADLPYGAAVVSVSGRFFAMDRDNRWERVKQAYDVMVSAEGKEADTAEEAIQMAYDAGETDEFVTPTAVGGFGGMKTGDGLLFVNFRADRAREILAALADPGFDAFDVSDRPKLAAVCGMVEYSDKHNAYMDVMYPNEDIVNTLGHWVAEKGLKQYRLAETEKYPHVTFFFNGGEETPEEGEERYVSPSPKVKTYDLQPEMSAPDVSDHLVAAIEGGEYDLIIVNYANPDMVGHTGDIDAAVAACEEVDRGVGRAIEALNKVGGAMILTADHGNCETMIDPVTGGPHTAHTTNPVPVVMINGPDGASLRDGGALCDLAPSLLELMNLDQPEEMTGESLIQR